MSVEMKAVFGQLARFTMGAAATTIQHVRNIGRVAALALRRGQLRRRLNHAEIEAGGLLARDGAGTEKLLEQIRQLDERIENLTQANSSTKSARAEQRGLFRRVFAACETDRSMATSPQIMGLREEVESAQNRIDGLRSQLKPGTRVELAQLGVGYGLTAVILLTVFASGAPKSDTLAASDTSVVDAVPTTAPPSKPPALAITSLNDNRVEQAVGFVVAGFHLIRGNGEQREIAGSTGSCFAISPDGQLLTNRHVVEEFENFKRAELLRAELRKKYLAELTPRLWVFLRGEKFDADTIYVDPKHDVAILRINRHDGPYFRISDGHEIPRATPVFALGYPGAAGIPLTDRETVRAVQTSESASKKDSNLEISSSS